MLDPSPLGQDANAPSTQSLSLRTQGDQSPSGPVVVKSSTYATLAQQLQQY